MDKALNKAPSHQGRFLHKLAFWTIKIMHDNPLLSYFQNPYELLEAAGSQKGQKVLEVGCGPGHFTIPAANIVGKEGLVYAFDVNPCAVESVLAKISKKNLKNVLAMLANASRTGLPAGMIDLAFVFGLPRIAGGLNNLLSEIHRVLKDEGLLAFRISRGSKKTFFAKMDEHGFVCYGDRKGILLFKKKSRSNKAATATINKI